MNYPFARLLTESVELTASQQEAHEALKNNPGSTAAELERKYNDQNLHKRLSELYRLGFAEKGSKRHCKVSKRKVDTWIAKPLPNS